MTGPWQFPCVRLSYKVGKSCIRHVVSSTPSCNSVRNAAMLLTQHVIIYQVLVENYASCNTVTEVLDIFKIASVMFFT
jgi:hypothetical protein